MPRTFSDCVSELNDLPSDADHELNLPGLRSWPLTHYPYLVFYLERADHVDVWRVLHGQRDIPGSLSIEG